MPNDLQIIRLPEVRRLTGLRSSSIYAGMTGGTFPKSILISKRAVGWLLDDILAWITSRINERNATKANTPPRDENGQFFHPRAP